MSTSNKILPILLSLSFMLFSSNVISEGLRGFGSHIFMFQEKMAKKGDVLAQYKLGTLYEFGVSVEPNIEKARYWYEVAMKKNHQPAINRYTYLDIKTSGFDPDKHKQWLSDLKAQVNEGEPNALILFGQMNRHGIGVTKNLDNALELLSEASSLGHTEVDSEIDVIMLEIDQKMLIDEKNKRKKANLQEKIDKENKQQQALKLKKRNKQKAEQAQFDKKRKRFEEVLRKQREEALLLEEQQKWAESQ